MQEQNLNWIALAIPDNCRNVFICVDGKLFDEKVKHGMIPLHDDRDHAKETAIPCLIGYFPTANPRCLDTLAGIPSPTPDAAPRADPHSHAKT